MKGGGKEREVVFDCHRRKQAMAKVADERLDWRSGGPDTNDERMGNEE